MSGKKGFFDGLFRDNFILWFIILFLLLFYGFGCGDGAGYREDSLDIGPVE